MHTSDGSPFSGDDRRINELLGRSVSLSGCGIAILHVTAPEAPIVYANAGLSFLTGYPPGEILGKSCSFLWGDGDSQAPNEKLLAALREGRECTVVLESCRKDKTPFRSEVKAYPVPDEDGRVVHFLCLMDDVTERVAYEEQLARRALRDPLTGLPNRAAFQERLNSILTRSDAAGGGVALLYLDLDNFKWVNDALGHSAGDDLLVAVADRLREIVGEEGMVARLGGDEFTVLLEGVMKEHQAIRTASQIVQELKIPFSLVQAGQNEVHTGTSVGIILGAGSDTAEDLINKADMAMYQAKEVGKGSYQLYESGMGQVAVTKLGLEADLRRGLVNDEFWTYYQPEIDTITGNVVGVEALLRWEHPDRGVLLPSQFVPLAEETGLIVPLGAWVLREACKHAERWRQLGAEPFILAVNLSARQLRRPEILEEIERAIREFDVLPQNLAIEITESVIMEDAPDALYVLSKLKSLGVKLAIDDFGTGYSSLSYLKRFPIDYLKIDRSFVSGLGQDTEDEVLVSAVVNLAQALGLKTVAEGVETAQQLESIKGYRCDLWQGRYFSGALSEADMETLLLQNTG